MKRSNLLFITLMATLYVLPVLAFGIACLMPNKNTFPQYNENIQVIEIDNPALKSDHVKVKIDNTYLYYEGDISHPIQFECKDSLLLLKGSQTAGEDCDLILHIGGNQNLKKIILNGEEIWTK